MFQKILLCSDGSDAAHQAAFIAAEIARHCEAEVISLSVFDLAALMTPYSFAPEAVPDVNLMLNIAQEEQARIQKEIGLILTDAGIVYRSVNEQGHPVSQICAVAQQEKVDLIVLGSRGLSQWQGLFLGSVADGVLHHAPCPVWIMRGQQTHFDKILLAWDSSAAADQAAQIASDLARKLEAALTLLNIVEPPGLIGHLIEEVSPKRYAVEARNFLQQRLQSITQQLGDGCSVVQESGHPAETIVRYAHENNFPLIVMGSRGVGSFQALTLGSVSNRVAHQAHCSLLIVR